MAYQQKKEDKKRFFASLDQLDDSTTESEDEIEALVQWNKRRKATSKSTPLQTTEERLPDQESRKLAREGSFEAPIIIYDTPKVRHEGSSTPIEQPSSPTCRPQSLIRPRAEHQGATVTSRQNVKASVTRKSKKVKDTVVLVSEEQRVFAGLRFFFVPNNDIAKPRKQRICMAQEHGAQWATTFDNTVTHVIVEPHLNYEETTKAFPSRCIPAGTTLVRVSWLSECIGSMYIRDVCQSRFRVKGAPEPPASSSRPTLPTTFDNETDVVDQQAITNSEHVNVSVSLDDELAQVIGQLKHTEYLPVDSGSEYNPSFSSVVPESSFGSATQIDGDNTAQETLRENRGFQCMRPSDSGDEENPNMKTINILQEMATIYDRSGDHWRTTAYRKAIAALRNQKTLISTHEEAIGIPQIGSRLADKIEEIVTTNRLRRLEEARADPHAQILQLFMGIYGVGPKQALLWIAQGHRTLADLLDHVQLTQNQKIGIAHYDDFAQRMPRAEVAQHADIVRRACMIVDKDLQVIIGGSYRRGSKDSGDIDLIITKPNADLAQIRALISGDVVPQLFTNGFMKCALATSSYPHTASHLSTKSKATESPGFIDVGEGSKFHGASCLPTSTIWRRIDLLFVPWNELGAAMIYFTGNDIFNRSMRLLASKKSMRLNQHGLYEDVMRGKGKVKMTDGTLLEGKNEKKIFEILGVPWREPEERNC